MQDYLQDRGCHCINDQWMVNDGTNEVKCDGTIVHSYYQWVPYFLLLMGFLFYLPKIIWDYFEEGKMTAVAKEVLAGSAQSKDYTEKVESVAKTVSQYIKNDRGGHRMYGLGYIISQALNLAVVVFCIYFTDAFLDGSFHDLGQKWIEANIKNDTVRNKPL